MHIFASVLVCLAGRQVLSFPAQARSRETEEVRPLNAIDPVLSLQPPMAWDAQDMAHPSKALALVILTLNPAAAFHPSGAPAHKSVSRKGNRLQVRSYLHRLASGSRRLNYHVPLMQMTSGPYQYSSYSSYQPPDVKDPCIPLEGMPFPEDGTILRGVPVVKVTDLAVFVEVDPDTKLQGIMYSAGCDVGFIKNLKKTFFVGDELDVKSLGISSTSAKLLLSRKAVIEEEGSEKHELPKDGRDHPRRHGVIRPREKEVPDPSIPPEGVEIPAAGTNLYALKVVRVEPLGIFLEVDADKKLVGYIPSSGVDGSYVRNIEKTFFVGDVVSAKCIGVSATSGKLLLSRKAIMEEEGSLKHELPQDGREQPRRTEPIPPQEIEVPDPSIPPENAIVPETGSNLRDLKVVRVEAQGIFAEVDSSQQLVGYMPSSGVDSNYVKNIEKTFRVGDRIDARCIGVSGITGKLLLSRKAIMDEEGWEAHELPDDGREMVKRHGPSGLAPTPAPAPAPPSDPEALLVGRGAGLEPSGRGTVEPPDLVEPEVEVEPVRGAGDEPVRGAGAEPVRGSAEPVRGRGEPVRGSG